ncbi:MAG: hypothetical protein AAB383_03740 [Patescibacteria group bacterium]
MHRTLILTVVLILLTAGLTACAKEDIPEELSFELTLENEAVETAVEGAALWLFAVDDGEDDLALSSETAGEIRMARMNTAGALTSEWVTVADSTDVDGQRIADHSHLYSEGYHWIVFSVTSAKESYLLKLDKNFERVFLKKLATEGPTNDMFAVAGEDGLYIGHFLPGTGHTIYQVDSDGNMVDTFPIGGGKFKHSNGASVVPSKDGFSVFAGETLNFRVQGALMRLDYTNAWAEAKSTTLVDEEDTNINMTSAVQWNDLWIVTARMTSSQSGSGSDSGSALQKDGGQIWRFVFDESGKELKREVLYNGDEGNRPHMELKDTLLITTWDVAGESMIRMEAVTEVY